MNYLSVCSGIEAATVAWEPLGFQPWAFAEIDAFPSAVLKHHYPQVPNLGDLTRFQEWPDAALDLLVGGTPCQSFSVAGLRAGLDDPRGSLMLVYLALARRSRPRWLVWENVPGVLSADAGRAFGSLLGGLAELGYGFAYRILDAQYFGLAQRRARVFVVGHLGDWRRAAAVLFERESLSGHPAPRRTAGEGIAASTAPSLTGSGRGVSRVGESRGQDPVIPCLNERTNERTNLPSVAMCLNAGAMGRIDAESETLIPIGGAFDGAEPFTLAIRGRGESHDLEYRRDGIANAVLTPNGGRAGIGVGAVAFDTTQITSPTNRCQPKAGDPCHPIASSAHPPAIAFSNTAGDTALGMSKPGVPPLTSRHGDPGNVLQGMQVRRLTPRECERLQGFPDDYTLIPYRGKPAKDGPRYKALGNSMAVPVMRWIGQRIQIVDQILAPGPQEDPR